MNVGEIFVKASLNNGAFNNQVSKTIKNSENAFSKGFSKIGKVIGTVFSIGVVTAFGKTCVQVASETQSAWIGLESILNGQNRSFSEAKDFLNEYTADGLIPLTDAVTAYKNLASRGYDDKQIRQTLTSLKDAAAFGRQASYSYGDAIKSATEGLKNENSVLVDNAGVTKNVAKMWEDYAKSVGKTTSELTQQEKINAEVNGILAETKFQLGDAAKYADTFAGRTARLSSTFFQLKNAIGETIMPIANLFIPVIQTAMEKLLSFFTIVKQVLAVFGLKSSKTISETASTYDSLGSSALGAADNTSKAAKVIKKANSLMGYDELNVMNKSSSSSSGSSGSSSSSTGSSSGSIGDLMEDTTEDVISPKAQKIAENIKKAWGTVKTAFKTGSAFVKKNWKSLASVIGAGAVAITTALAGIKIAQFIGNIKAMITALGSAKGIFSALAAAIGGVSAPVLAVIAAIALLAGGFAYLYINSENFRNSVNQIINAFVTSLIPAIQFLTSTVIPDIINGFNTFMVIMQPVIDFVQGALSDAWNKVLQPALLYIANTVLPTLISTFENLWNNVLVPLGEFIASVLEPTIKILTEAFQILWDNVLLPLCDFIGSVLSKTFESIATIFNETIIPAINEGIAIFNWLWQKVLQPIVNFLWKTFKPGFEIVTNEIGDVFGGLKTVFSGVLDFVTDVFTGDWEKAWNGVKDIFSGIWDTLGAIISTPLNLILSGVEGLINGIIQGFNAIKKSLNKLSFDIPDWIPVIGGQKWGFNFKMSEEVSLPRLAEGGWVEPNKPRPVIVGDNKREGEIIAPESKIYDQAYRAAKAVQIQNNNPNRLLLEIQLKYPDGRTMIQEINETQIKDGKITLLT